MPDERPHPRVRLAAFATVVILLTALYLTRPDGLSALHWWPMIVWTPLALLPFLSFRFRPLRRPFLLALVGWGLALHLVREPSALVFLPPHTQAAGSFRIVSLNCSAGTVAAADEAFAQGADVVLLQEVGSRQEFVAAARRAGYPYVAWSMDDAVFARRPLRTPSSGLDFAAATMDLGGRPIRVMSLRLTPPVFRLDLWNPECWGAYADDARQRRERLRTILPSGPCLFGGDFNATNPRLVTDDRPGFNEAGRSAGRGWRGTGTNDFPMVAVDQIWASPEFHWTQAYARKTQNSDHRMLVGEFEVVKS